MPAVDLDATAQMGKFVVIKGSPPMSPGCCFLCSTSNQEVKYIDPRRDLEWHGTIYFCENCVTEMGQNLGMLDFGQSADLLDDNRILLERNSEQATKIEQLEQTIDLLSQRRLSDRVTGNSNPVVTGQASLQDNSQAGVLINQGPEDTESGLAEQITEQGPDDLPGANSDDAGASILDI